MYFKPSSLPFISMMILGSIMTISANSWFPIWMGMEMNIVGFIPLMINKKNIFSAEATIKYFIIQAVSSSIIILTTIQNNFFYLSNDIINLALLSKIGAAPFHFWVPSLIEQLTWINISIMLTWQKLAPLIILNLNFNNSMIIMLTLISSMIFGSLGGLNQTSIKKILAFSSIAHMSWLLAAVMMGINLMIIYFLMYSLSVILTINISNNLKISNINNSYMLEKKSKMMLYIIMLNLGGMPPLMGFFPKLLIILYLIKVNMTFIPMLLVVSAMINLFFYLRITYTALSINTFSKKNMFNMYNFPPFFTTLILMSGPMMMLFL